MTVSLSRPATAASLAAVTSPEAVRALPAERLPMVAEEIRSFLVERVCAAGGHLGPNLGAVELTLALHRVFDSPRDALVFDIGHQGYVHKLLTGRGEGFARLRQAGGLSGYPSRAESGHDLVENSHASTALSYADGLAKARQLSGQSENRAVVAVIGDGALTGGLAWEALNNLGAARERPVVVVVNDNGRSYAPTTGSLAAHLDILKRGGGGQGCQNLFTELGFAYFGPVDGHSIGEMEGVLRRARSLQRPVVVHVRTIKGKGYGPAEGDEADCLHAVGTVDPATGAPPASAGVSGPSWTSVFGEALKEQATQRADLVAVTASMLRPTGLHAMAEAFPDRVFDVGIAEQHAVTSAAGLAMGGLHPVVAIYATFLNRAFDQVLMDVALHRLPVTFVLDRAGVTGPDGPSHHGMWDLSVLSAVPHLRFAAPRDPARLRDLLREATDVGDGPSVLRIPKGPAADGIEAVARMDGMDILHRGLRHALDVLLVAVGPLAAPALETARALERQDVGTTVVDPRWVLPVHEALPALAARHRLVVTVEDGLRHGGVGAALAQACREAAVGTPVVPLGLPRAFLPHDSRSALLAGAGLDHHGILHAVRRALARQPGTSPAHPVSTTRTGRTQ
ncbi:1-deoxy-D-xylulose-5-phosphate synthase [Streptomyces boncukensis]|uniref:1-deoxy-D-xylulose-5-phosphate synthase n=1 Tax=Streptomyces boncukensis TaxID=2711219 RepID=A0A6G4WX75_9ACTN|nr:1-deoxy-D-xylulose-5-phosphate synthase [Streptomyces boncukensis]NGO69886.1 1-deoxy-D-xylulose-5-phosphate synthase [Streptomyces boncukensis]